MCALLVGLPDVTVVGGGDWPSWLRVVVTIDAERPGCSCGGAVLNRPGSDGDSGYWFPTPIGEACWAA